jgi:hypothetical protein
MTDGGRFGGNVLTSDRVCAGSVLFGSFAIARHED